MSLDGEFRHLLGIIAHELRTPLGAIVGYQELLSDGLMSPLPDRALDAVRRIGTSSSQMRHLIDGLTDLMLATGDTALDLGEVDAAEPVAVAAESARALAAGRSVKLETEVLDALPSLVTDAARLTAALDLALGAAIRASPGASLTLTFADDQGALLTRIEGTALRPVGEDGGNGHMSIDSGPALRIAMAARILELLGGTLTVEGSPATLTMRVPSAPLDAGAATPGTRTSGGVT